jgi:hypothetical protein
MHLIWTVRLVGLLVLRKHSSRYLNGILRRTRGPAGRTVQPLHDAATEIFTTDLDNIFLERKEMLRVRL